MFDTILVPTDGSDCARAAVGYAEDLGRQYDATVHTLCVVDSRRIENARQYDTVKQERVEIVEEASDRLSARGVPAEHAVRTGVPHKSILEYAGEQGVDLVVMGTHGRTGVERFLLGSVTEKVIRLSDTPVLTVNDATGDAATYPYTDILVPTDGSEGAEVAAGPAVDIASTYDARFHTLSVIDTMMMGVDVPSGALFDALEESAESAVESITEQATGGSVPAVESTTEYGNPYRRIRAYIDEHDIGLVVMGTHGRTGIARYLLGSVTEKIVRTSPVPVMTVRKPE